MRQNHTSPFSWRALDAQPVIHPAWGSQATCGIPSVQATRLQPDIHGKGGQGWGVEGFSIERHSLTTLFTARVLQTKTSRC